MPNLTQRLKENLDKLIKLNASPHKIAMGFAVGAFVGVFPTFYLGGIIIIGLSALFRLNYTAAILGALIIMNPVTTPLFWIASAWVGSLIFSQDAKLIVELIKNKMIFKSFGRIAVVYLTGNLIISVIVSAASYYIVKGFVLRRGSTPGKNP